MSVDPRDPEEPDSAGYDRSIHGDPQPESSGGGHGERTPRATPLTDDDDDDRIGYKRPPKKHRFQPGQSGNSAGRPKGAKGT